jgi:hypothetical protein
MSRISKVEGKFEELGLALDGNYQLVAATIH